MADGCAAAPGGRRIVRGFRIDHARIGSRSAAPADAAHRRRACPHASAGRSRGLCGVRARSELFHRDASQRAAARVHAAALRSAPLEHRGQPAVRPANVSQPDQHLARGTAQDDDAGGRRSGESDAALSGARRDGIPAGLQCLGGLGQAHGERQADSRERSASGVVHPGGLVSGASQGAWPGRDRRIAAGRPWRDYRAQPTDRLGRDQSRVRRSRPLHRKDRSADRPIRYFAARWSRRGRNRNGFA